MQAPAFGLRQYSRNELRMLAGGRIKVADRMSLSVHMWGRIFRKRRGPAYPNEFGQERPVLQAPWHGAALVDLKQPRPTYAGRPNSFN